MVFCCHVPLRGNNICCPDGGGEKQLVDWSVHTQLHVDDGELLHGRYDKKDLTHGVLYWGDERGHVSAIEFSGCQDLCFFTVRLADQFPPVKRLDRLVGL